MSAVPVVTLRCDADVPDGMCGAELRLAFLGWSVPDSTPQARVAMADAQLAAQANPGEDDLIDVARHRARERGWSTRSSDGRLEDLCPRHGAPGRRPRVQLATVQLGPGRAS